ncbi:MAG TPA: DNA gyrase inhibitor YacG [Thermodesulfobacteriota bacterium]|jgi:endogenous inhibitor of DNA gyrase (YacG/DUF329 family)
MQVKCPRCSRFIEWEGNNFRPFCSERCKLLDLGTWAKEEYKIEGEIASLEVQEQPIPSHSGK